MSGLRSRAKQKATTFISDLLMGKYVRIHEQLHVQHLLAVSIIASEQVF